MNRLPLHIYQESEPFSRVANYCYWVVAFSDPGGWNRNIMRKWCTEQFGPGLGNMRVDNSPFVHRWLDDIEYGELRFRDESDAATFCLWWQN